MLTKKENFLRVMHGEVPEYVPIYHQSISKRDPVESLTNLLFEPSCLKSHKNPDGSLSSIWGVHMISSANAEGGFVSDPNVKVITDITKWRDQLKVPDFSDVDWEMLAKKDIERSGINRETTSLTFVCGMGMFMPLMQMMGFEDGLCALFEEPEACEELLDFLCDFHCDIIDKCMDYYAPDLFTIKDDSASANGPMVSMDMYMKFFYPRYARIAKRARDQGIPISFHNCGKSQSQMERNKDYGVIAWEPAQNMNDLVGFKKKYGRSFALIGGWQGRDELLRPEVTDEMLYESVKYTIDLLGEDGGFVWYGYFLGESSDPEIWRRNTVVRRAVEEYGGSFYKH